MMTCARRCLPEDRNNDFILIKLGGEGPNCALDKAKHHLLKVQIKEKKNKDAKTKLFWKISRGKKNAGMTPKMLFENAVWR